LAPEPFPVTYLENGPGKIRAPAPPLIGSHANSPTKGTIPALRYMNDIALLVFTLGVFNPTAHWTAYTLVGDKLVGIRKGPLCLEGHLTNSNPDSKGLTLPGGFLHLSLAPDTPLEKP
jgi:hypothetical protein